MRLQTPFKNTATIVSFFKNRPPASLQTRRHCRLYFSGGTATPSLPAYGFVTANAVTKRSVSAAPTRKLQTKPLTLSITANLSYIRLQPAPFYSNYFTDYRCTPARSILFWWQENNDLTPVHKLETANAAKKLPSDRFVPSAPL